MVALQRFALFCALAVSTVSAFSVQGRSHHINHARSVQGRSNMVMADTGLHKRAARRCATSSPGSAPSRTPSPSPTTSVSPTVVDSSSSSPSPTPTPESDEIINSSSQSSSTSSSDFVPPPSPSPSSEPAPTSSSDPVPSPSPTPDPSPSPAGPEQALTTPDSSTSTPPPPPPPPTPTPEPPQNNNPPPPPPPPPSGGGGGGAGQITFYSTGLGACGWVNHDSDFIAAVSIPMFDGWPGANGNPNQNPICGRQAQITSGGKSIVVTVTDRCEGCAYGDFDLSPSAFNALQDFGVGRTGCTYQFL